MSEEEKQASSIERYEREHNPDGLWSPIGAKRKIHHRDGTV